MKPPERLVKRAAPETGLSGTVSGTQIWLSGGDGLIVGSSVG